MLQTYEALLEPDGHLRFLEAVPKPLSEPHRVLVTFTEQIGRPQALQEDWQKFVGSLQDSPNLNGDPLAIQQGIRREWD